MRVTVLLVIVLVAALSWHHYNTGASISHSPPGVSSISSTTAATSGILSSSTVELGKYASWEAHEGNGVFALESTGGLPQFSLVLPDHSKHFQFSMGDYNNDLPTGNSIPLILSFDDGSKLQLTGTSDNGQSITSDLPDGLVADWTHHFTANHEMTVSFPGSTLKPWIFQLMGTTQVVTALAKAMQDAGITGLPAPWYDAPNSSPSNIVEQNSPGSTTTPHYGPQDVWNGDPYSCNDSTDTEQCLKQTMVNGGASPQAIAFAASEQFGEWLSFFQNEGKISIGTISTFANDNPEQPVILNAQPPLINVWSLPYPQDPSLLSMKQAHPNAYAIHAPNFLSASQIPEGGQSFTYEVQLQECGVCGGIKYNETLIFDSEGKLVREAITSLKYDKN